MSQVSVVLTHFLVSQISDPHFLPYLFSPSFTQCVWNSAELNAKVSLLNQYRDIHPKDKLTIFERCLRSLRNCPNLLRAGTGVTGNFWAGSLDLLLRLTVYILLSSREIFSTVTDYLTVTWLCLRKVFWSRSAAFAESICFTMVVCNVAGCFLYKFHPCSDIDVRLSRLSYPLAFRQARFFLCTHLPFMHGKLKHLLSRWLSFRGDMSRQCSTQAICFDFPKEGGNALACVYFRRSSWL